MICRTTDTRMPAAAVGIAGVAVAGVTYDLTFWLAYASNLTLMIAHSLLFRYADFVLYLGGSEFRLGWIVGLGMLGCLAMRLAQGVGIDRYGPRTMWVASTALFAVSCFGHLAISNVDGPAIFLLRIAYNCAIAGFFGASITFISAHAPVTRMAEVVGMLGTSGFMAMVIGAWIGDLLLGQTPIEMSRLQWMFSLAGALGLVSMTLGWLATRGEIHVPRADRFPPSRCTALPSGHGAAGGRGDRFWTGAAWDVFAPLRGFDRHSEDCRLLCDLCPDGVHRAVFDAPLARASGKSGRHAVGLGVDVDRHAAVDDGDQQLAVRAAGDLSGHSAGAAFPIGHCRGQ